jgi:hypothetical protein
MSNLEDARNSLFRLKRALDALSADLDERERRTTKLWHRGAAATKVQGIEACVDHFAFVVERTRSANKSE